VEDKDPEQDQEAGRSRSMKPGDIVELKADHSLKEYFPGPCVVLKTESRRFRGWMTCRCFISTLEEREGERNLTWAYDGELVPLSERRDSILRELGI